MLSDVEIEEFADGPAREMTIRNELSGHFEKVRFPPAEVVSGEFMSDSDARSTHFPGFKHIDPKRLPTLQAHMQGAFAEVLRRFK